MPGVNGDVCVVVTAVLLGPWSAVGSRGGECRVHVAAVSGVVGRGLRGPRWPVAVGRWSGAAGVCDLCVGCGGGHRAVCVGGGYTGPGSMRCNRIQWGWADATEYHGGGLMQPNTMGVG